MNKVTIVIDANPDRAKQAISSLQGSISSLEGVAVRSFRSTTQSVDGLTSGLKIAEAQLNSLVSAGYRITAGISAPIIGAIGYIARMGSVLERAQISFEVLSGSAEKATRHIQELRQFAITTPFNFTTLLENSRVLQAVGFQMENIIPTLKAFGNALVTSGGGNQQLDRIVLQLAHIQGLQRVSLRELNPIARAGIPIFSILAEAIAKPGEAAEKTSRRLRDLLHNGLLPAQETLSLLTAELNKKFPEGLEKQNQTVQVKFSNLIDAIEFLAQDLGRAFEPVTKAFIDFAINFVQGIRSLVSGFKDLPTSIKFVIGSIIALLAVIGPVTLAVSLAIRGFLALRQTLTALPKAIELVNLAHADYIKRQVEATAATKAETAAINEQTAAMEANTAAKAANTTGSAINIAKQAEGFIPLSRRLESGPEALFVAGQARDKGRFTSKTVQGPFPVPAVIPVNPPIPKSAIETNERFISRALPAPATASAKEAIIDISAVEATAGIAAGDAAVKTGLLSKSYQLLASAIAPVITLFESLAAGVTSVSGVLELAFITIAGIIASFKVLSTVIRDVSSEFSGVILSIKGLSETLGVSSLLKETWESTKNSIGKIIEFAKVPFDKDSLLGKIIYYASGADLLKGLSESIDLLNKALGGNPEKQKQIIADREKTISLGKKMIDVQSTIDEQFGRSSEYQRFIFNQALERTKDELDAEQLLIARKRLSYEAERAAETARIEALAREKGGISEIAEYYEKFISQHATLVKTLKSGDVAKEVIQLSPKAISDIYGKITLDITRLNNKMNEDLVKTHVKTEEIKAKKTIETLKSTQQLEATYDEYYRASEQKTALESSKNILRDKTTAINKETQEAIDAIKEKYSVEIAEFEKTEARKREGFEQALKALPNTEKGNAIREQIRKGANDAEINQILKVFELRQQLEAEVTAIRVKGANEVKELEIKNITEIREAQKRAEDEIEKSIFERIHNSREEERNAINANKQSQLDSLSVIQAVSLGQRLELESKHFQVEYDNILKLNEVAKKEIEDKFLKEEDELRKNGVKSKLQAEDIEAQVLELKKKRISDEGKIEQEKNIAINNEYRKLQIQQLQIVRDNANTIFDKINSSTNSILDQMLSRSKSIGQAIGDAIKGGFLSIFKTIASAQISKYITEITTGQKVRFEESTTARSPIGTIGRFLGRAGLGRRIVGQTNPQLRNAVPISPVDVIRKKSEELVSEFKKALESGVIKYVTLKSDTVYVNGASVIFQGERNKSVVEQPTNLLGDIKEVFRNYTKPVVPDLSAELAERFTKETKPPALEPKITVSSPDIIIPDKQIQEARKPESFIDSFTKVVDNTIDFTSRKYNELSGAIVAQNRFTRTPIVLKSEAEGNKKGLFGALEKDGIARIFADDLSSLRARQTNIHEGIHDLVSAEKASKALSGVPNETIEKLLKGLESYNTIYSRRPDRGLDEVIPRLFAREEESLNVLPAEAEKLRKLIIESNKDTKIGDTLKKIDESFSSKVTVNERNRFQKLIPDFDVLPEKPQVETPKIEVPQIEVPKVEIPKILQQVPTIGPEDLNPNNPLVISEKPRSILPTLIPNILGSIGLGVATNGVRGGGNLQSILGGGLLGAAIGAITNFGISNSFTNRVKEKIKQVYGVELNNKGVLDYIVNAIKQNFGGNIDLGIRDPRIRDLILEYGRAIGVSKSIPPFVKEANAPNELGRTGTVPTIPQSSQTARRFGNFSLGALFPSIGGVLGGGFGGIGVGKIPIEGGFGRTVYMDPNTGAISYGTESIPGAGLPNFGGTLIGQSGGAVSNLASYDAKQLSVADLPVGGKVFGQIANAPLIYNSSKGGSTLSRLGGLFPSFFNSGSIQLAPGIANTAAGIGGFGGALAGFASSPGAALLGLSLFGSGVTAGLDKRPVAGGIQGGVGGALVGGYLGANFGLGGGLAAGAVGGGLIGAGVPLLLAGMNKTGFAGYGLSVAGGAAIGAGIGFLVGGPLGAAIGAGIGAVAGGLTRLIRGKTIEQRIREKVKELYHVDITNYNILKQMGQVIKQNYGGDVDLGIRSPQMRELIGLYAKTTGQYFPLENKPRPLYLSDVGGTLFQTASYENGQSIAYAGGAPTLQSVDRLISGSGYNSPIAGSPFNGLYPSGYSTPSSIQLDGEATTAFLQGQAVETIQGNPRLVQSASLQSQNSSSGRKENAIVSLSPNLITR